MLKKSIAWNEKMNLKKLFKSRKTFYIFIFSYLLILLLSITFSYTINSEAAKIVERETSSANLTLLTHLQQTLDMSLQDVKRISFQIAFNPRVLTAIRFHTGTIPSDQYNLYKAIEDIRHYVVASEFVTGVYIYMHRSRTVITQNTHLDARLFFNVNYNESSLSFEEWENIMLTAHRSSFIMFQGRTPNSKVGVAHLQSIPIETIRNPLATIVVTINEKILENALKEIETSKNGTALILNEYDGMFATPESLNAMSALSQFREQTEDYLEYDNGIFHIYLNGEKTVLSVATSRFAGWKYVSIVPYGLFWEKVQQLRYFVWFGLFITLIIGGFLAYILSKRNYLPIKNIIDGIEKRNSTKTHNLSNEFSFIQDSISGMISENERISIQVDEQKKLLMNSYFLNVLKGKTKDDDSDKEWTTALNMKFQSNYFVVILMKLNDVDENLHLSAIRRIGQTKSTKYSKFVVLNFIELNISKTNQCMFVEDEDGVIVCLANLKSIEHELDISNLREILKETREFVKSNFEFDFTIAMSNAHQGLFGIAQAYKEANEVMEFILLSEAENDMDYSELALSTSLDYHYSIEMEQKLINCIKSGDYEAARSVLMDILKENFSRKSFSSQMIKCLMFDLVSTVLKSAENMRDASFLEELQPVKQLMECNNIMEMKFKLADILRRVCEYVALSKSNKCNLLGTKVKEYVAQHYFDPNLGVAMIGDYFGLTPSYLSKLFKEQENESYRII